MERLAALEKIHLSSPDLAVQFQAVQKAQPEISKCLWEESERVAQVKELMVSSLKEIQELLSVFLVK